MRAVLQRVLQASVEVNGQQISKIKQGLCVLVGLSVDDTTADIDFMVRKLLSVRVFDSNQNALASTEATEATEVSESTEIAPAKMWNKNVVDIEGEILCVSQFTLYGQVLKGSKPDFHLSMKSEMSRQMYHDFLDRLKKAYRADRIKDGEFGAMMLVNIANDGPVTLELDSRKFEYVPIANQSSSAAKTKGTKPAPAQKLKENNRQKMEQDGDKMSVASSVDTKVEDLEESHVKDEPKALQGVVSEKVLSEAESVLSKLSLTESEQMERERT